MFFFAKCRQVPCYEAISIYVNTPQNTWQPNIFLCVVTRVIHQWRHFQEQGLAIGVYRYKYSPLAWTIGHQTGWIFVSNPGDTAKLRRLASSPERLSDDKLSITITILKSS